ncbi:unnamed protein product [Schistosoma spindalis]|nr:unnamed protein product [Schistosoma spindale]
MATPCTKPTMDSNRPYCHQSSLEMVDTRLSLILEYLIGLRPCSSTGTHLLEPHWTQNRHTKRPIRTELSNEETKRRFQEQLRSHLGSSENEADPDVAWKDIQTAVETAVTSLSDLNERVTKNQWISSRSIALMDSRKLIPSGSEHDEERKQIRSRLSKSLRNDREQWWATKAKEMEKAAAIGNTRQLYRLIKGTGINKSSESKIISEKDNTLICSQSRRLERWAEHFREQSGWPSVTLQLPPPFPDSVNRTLK